MSFAVSVGRCVTDLFIKSVCVAHQVQIWPHFCCSISHWHWHRFITTTITSTIRTCIVLCSIYVFVTAQCTRHAHTPRAAHPLYVEQQSLASCIWLFPFSSFCEANKYNMRNRFRVWYTIHSDWWWCWRCDITSRQRMCAILGFIFQLRSDAFAPLTVKVSATLKFTQKKSHSFSVSRI